MKKICDSKVNNRTNNTQLNLKIPLIKRIVPCLLIRKLVQPIKIIKVKTN